MIKIKLPLFAVMALTVVAANAADVDPLSQEVLAKNVQPSQTVLFDKSQLLRPSTTINPASSVMTEVRMTRNAQGEWVVRCDVKHLAGSSAALRHGSGVMHR